MFSSRFFLRINKLLIRRDYALHDELLQLPKVSFMIDAAQCIKIGGFVFALVLDVGRLQPESVENEVRHNTSHSTVAFAERVDRRYLILRPRCEIGNRIISYLERFSQWLFSQSAGKRGHNGQAIIELPPKFMHLRLNRNARRGFDTFQLFDIFAVLAEPPRDIRKDMLEKESKAQRAVGQEKMATRWRASLIPTKVELVQLRVWK